MSILIFKSVFWRFWESINKSCCFPDRLRRCHYGTLIFSFSSSFLVLLIPFLWFMNLQNQMQNKMHCDRPMNRRGWNLFFTNVVFYIGTVVFTLSVSVMILSRKKSFYIHNRTDYCITHSCGLTTVFVLISICIKHKMCVAYVLFRSVFWDL